MIGNSISFSRYQRGNKNSGANVFLPPFPHFRPHKISFYLEYMWHKFFYQKKIHIVHPTEFALTPTGHFFLKKGAKLVITIHDLIHEKFGTPKGLYDLENRTNFYTKADGYIFVSNSTKNDFGNHYPSLICSKPSKVIWHGNNFDTNEISVEKKKQFLFVGSRNGYKNFDNACLAFEKTLKQNQDCVLMIAGSSPCEEEKWLGKRFGTKVKWVENPNDQTLKKIYSESLALLYVSKYEGFGMPLVEAMSQGCVPIAGNHSSIPEVMADAGISVNVSNPEEISRAMIRCIQNNVDIVDIRKKGQFRANLFNWKNTVETTHEFYHRLCK